MKIAFNSIFIKHNDQQLRILFQDIVFIEAMENYCKIGTIKGDFIIHFTLLKILETLPNKFIQVHRSYIVNIEHVSHIERDIVYFAKKTSEYIVGPTLLYVPIGATYKKLFLNQLHIID